MATTVQQVVDAVSQDVRKVLGTTGGDAAILIDYVNRVHSNILRHSKWYFMISDPKRFITEDERSDYFVGTGTATAGAANTQLAIADLGYIQRGSVYDRSNFRRLQETDTAPLASSLTFQDAQGRPGRPRLWRHSPYNSSVINLFPPPDNQNSYQPVPAAPLVQSSAAGALAYRQYYVKAVLLDDNLGISAPSATTVQFIPSARVAVVSSPSVIVGPDIMLEGSFAAGVLGYSTWDVYIGTSPTSLTKQNVAAIAIGTNFTEPTTGLIAGAALPSGAPTITTLGGYIIEFRYYKSTTILTLAADNLQVPDEFKDVVVAGVNALAYLYLKRPGDAQIWQTLYIDGLRQLIKLSNQRFGGEGYMGPDPASISTGSGFYYDPSNIPFL